MRDGRWALRVGLVALLSVMPAFAETSSKALDLAKARVQEADFRATGHFVTVDGAGKRVNYPMTIKGKWLEGALHLLCVITGPPQAQKRILLVMRPDGQSSVKVEKGGEKTAKTVAPPDLGESVVGALSYDDLLESQWFWKQQAVAQHVKYGARDCDVITSTPGAADRTAYAQVKSWLDETIGFPVHAEKTAKRGGIVKDFSYLGLRQNGGVWSASQVEVKVNGQAGETLLVIERGSPHAHVGPQELSLDPAAP